MAEAMVLATLFAAVGGLVWLDTWQRRRREARRRADEAFAAVVWDRMARGSRRRPKVDRRIQRRRYAR